MHLVRKLMGHIGLNTKRLRLEWISASEGSRFAQLMDEFTKELDELGPLGESEGLDADTLKRELEKVGRMVPQLKILAREKLQVKVKSEEAYSRLYSSEKTVQLLDDFIADPASSAEELPAYYIDPTECVGCQVCMKKCPTGAIAGDKKTIHVIDQDICTHCGTCYYVCPPKVDAVRKMVDEEIPPPIPLEERDLSAKS
jgi:ferredoxin